MEGFTPMPIIALWKHKVSNDGLKNVYTDVSIQCTFKQHRHWTKNDRGDDVMSTAIVRCVEEIQPGDLITVNGRSWPVLSVDDVSDVNNEVLEHKLSL